RHADNDAADFDRRLGRARGHDGPGLRLCGTDDERGGQRFAAVWRRNLRRRRDRRPGLDSQSRKGCERRRPNPGDGGSMIGSAPSLALIAFLLAALLSAGAIPAIYPLLLKYALARPNARSSHRIATPQGAGI